MQLTNQIDALKKELARVRQQKNAARKALVKLAHDKGFFNPEWEKSEDAWLEEDYGLGNPVYDPQSGLMYDPAIEDMHGYPTNRTLSAERAKSFIKKGTIITWANWWVKLKEWDLLGQPGTPYPARIQNLHAQFTELDTEIKEAAQALGDQRFSEKHPGLGRENRFPHFPDELILACWEDEN
jgi:hypothetical protein